MPSEPDSLAWIEKLIAIDTSSRLSNLPLIQLVERELEALGVNPIVCPSPLGDKANLVATIPAADGTTAGGLVLSGHTDVVPTDGQSWASDPFAATVRDGKVYGRGSADMKGFIAVVLSMVPAMLRASLSQPIHIALSYDEETGLQGGAQMIEDFRGLGLTPQFCIVGEPTNMQVVTGHKGIALVDITVRGRAAHSSLAPRVVNAVTYGARIVDFIGNLADEFRDDGPFDEAYDIPFSTASVNSFAGGGEGNTVPAESHLRLDFRTFTLDPNDVLQRIHKRVSELEEQMQTLDNEASIEITDVAMAPGLDNNPDAPVIQLLTSSGAICEGGKKAYATEAGFFHEAGISTVVCGPGDIEQAHRTDEFVSIAQLMACEEILGKLIYNLEN